MNLNNQGIWDIRLIPPRETRIVTRFFLLPRRLNNKWGWGRCEVVEEAFYDPSLEDEPTPNWKPTQWANEYAASTLAR